tara:strand:+ start:522 stop:884 length:363 start_codon:yes stop_codon:yes gene_type:complete
LIAQATPAAVTHTFTNYSPNTSLPISTHSPLNNYALDTLISDSRKAFKLFSKLPAPARGGILETASKLVRNKYASELAHLTATDAGIPLNQALSGHVEAAAETLEYWGNLATQVRRAYSR